MLDIVKHIELLTGNKMLVYFCVFSRVGDPVALHCLDQHPNQQHIVATGGEDGVLSVWDTRQERSPVTQREAHTSNSKQSMIVIHINSFNSCLFV